MPKQSKQRQREVSRKIAINAREMKQGRLRSGGGNHPKVRDWNQMIAISESQVRKAHSKRGSKQHRRK